MTTAGSPRPDPSAIGVIPKPPLVRLPNPLRLFEARAARLRRLAEGHDLGPYLRFLGDLAELQGRVQEDLSPVDPPAAEEVARSVRHAMPPLDRSGFVPGAEIHALIDRMIAAAGAIDMPPAARVALGRLAAADAEARTEVIRNVLMDAVPFEAIAEHALVAAALQVHFARLAAGLDAGALQPVADGVCPCCGGAPTASLVVVWHGAEGARYCACSLCGTLWNYVRSKCTLCGSTREISFREIDGGGGTVKAEVCGDCQGYVKVLYQAKAPDLDPVADDVASLGLDMLLREQGLRRGAVNPFLIGY